MESDALIKERKEKFIAFLKKKYLWITYVFLAVLVWLSVKIRTANLPGLKDITTGSWTLGPDLDPFLFLRWAKYIVANGTLYALDTMRYVPLGFNTRSELLLHPYMIAWFHSIASKFGSVSVEHSAVLYPVFFFAITVIAFFFLVRRIFLNSLGEPKSNIVALISSFFLIVIPALLPGTIAGIPEKESVGFFFLFLAFYGFVAAWTAKKPIGRYIYSIIAGAATAAMALSWGGYTYIFATLSLTALAAFILGKMDTKKTISYALWLGVALLLMIPSSTRYSITNLLTATTTAPSFFVLGLCIIDLLIGKYNLQRYYSSTFLAKIPRQASVFIITLVLGIILAFIAFGPGFFGEQISSIKSTLITPVSDRLGITVAENRQPYFPEWSQSFGPIKAGIPIFFWLFFIGSVYLFHHMLKNFNKKDQWLMTLSYLIFLFCIIFSRYTPESKLNGTNTLSLLVYSLGFISLLAMTGYYYYAHHKKADMERFKSIDIGLILIFMFFFLSIVSARGAVRLIMVLVPSASVIVGFFVVATISDALKNKKDDTKMFAWALAIIIFIAAFYSGLQFYKISSGSAVGYVPSEYTYQWQKAMSWVRENTQKDAVFSHWWDYGYWLQSIGERGTVLDGGNAIPYWDHLMGRHTLTAPDDVKALEFLYAHKTTHFLIDSTDVGKYSAFSSIGADEKHDRASWISSFERNNEQTTEAKNGTLYLYQGGSVLDEDLIYEQNGTKILLPGKKVGIAGVIIEKNDQGVLTKNPIGIFVYQDNNQNKRYDLPLRYAYSNNTFIDFGSGVSSGIFLVPRLVQNANGGSIEYDGALLYLSNRTVKSQVARLYLYNEDNPYFKLVHSEDDVIVNSVREANIPIGDFVYYGGIRGPIRIWEIDYPENIELKEEYLEKDYPNDALRRA